MSVKEIKIYETTDGTRFQTKKEAEEYQEELDNSPYDHEFKVAFTQKVWCYYCVAAHSKEEAIEIVKDNFDNDIFDWSTSVFHVDGNLVIESIEEV